jgi:prophage antirepressor-like protein
MGMANKKQHPVGLKTLLEGEKVRRVNQHEQTWYAAADVVSLLGDDADSEALWAELKQREPKLRQLIRHVEFPSIPGRPDVSEAVNLEGLFRLIQSIPTTRAERLKDWLARSGRDRVREAENPELLAVRARTLYERKGYSRRWVDKRLRGISARHELTGEWFKRGAIESEQFRALTNRLMHNAFGMDVENYRRYKNLTGGNQHLRDHMSDLELALTTLGETVAVALHQARDSSGMERLEADTAEAGEIVAQTRQQIEQRSGRAVVHPGNHAPPARRRHGAHPGAELADKAGDMHNPSPPHPVRTVA